MRLKFLSITLMCISLLSIQCKKASTNKETPQIKFASFNVSMESENYLGRGAEGVSAQVLIDSLASGKSKHIMSIASIIQEVRPDVILLNEFDYIENPEEGVEQFIEAYLKVDQENTKAIDYPYYYYSTSNTGVETSFDLNRDGEFEGNRNDAFGYGRYPGHYGMVLLSRYPIDTANVRTFQKFKWKDMPDFLETKSKNGEDFYSPEAWEEFRLSSKSHWDVPIQFENKVIHVLASHPTPPGFDGEEDRNGKRNHDEIRFWGDYVDEHKGSYMYDDKDKKGGLGDASFVIMGDLNASPDEGSAINDGIKSLLNHPKVNNQFTPSSKGGKLHSPDNAFGKFHTVLWRLRADYVLPSSDLKVLDHGLFWPIEGEPLHELMADREASSDHRLVWVEIGI
ncbi:endonuclease/exonuclease/phosphatase family protein [Psychroflexus lacisalsi]|jgi:endonuclease/exonuclease/phosphatase family metal-dependent hydrolase|uniref:Endonuclease/exonuclease/phosphatase family protein n=1 Tax=Psychroflexus lacisalsi TaxID=503928 RepID=A0ABN1K1D2_9FLAO|nr:endonuclease/exonuclease/phosphatase family protein [Psychroflexus lacisalsi]MBZ9620883.1 endonuclease/exonuclease/phosphatase family protein [Psychroflexus lacisalsi]